MTHTPIQEFAAIATRLVGELDIIAHEAIPNPWFCKDIFRKRDLQWAGYVGDFSKQEHALVFGINLEFTPAWRKVYPKIKENPDYLLAFLRKHKNLEWHWMARPGVIARNPEIRYLSPRMWTFQVNLNEWLDELEDILDRKKMWSASAPMRPQVQIVRYIGIPNQLFDVSLIMQNLHQTVIDLEPLVDFLGK